MSANPIPETQAWQIAQEFARELRALDPQSLLAVYVIGSLGGGYYRPGLSDIDTVAILRDQASLTQSQAEQLAEKYQQRYEIPKGFGVNLVLEKELFPPYLKSQQEEFEFSLEIARLKTQSKLLLGSYNLDTVPMPGRADLILDARIMEAWFEREYGSDLFANLDVTSSVNSILLYLKRYLMISRGIFEWNKTRVIAVYLAHQPPLVNPVVFGLIEKYLSGYEPLPDELAALRQFGRQIRALLNWQHLGR